MTDSQMNWAAPAVFFDLPPTHPLKGPLGELELVWQILDSLAGWIQARLRPNVALPRQKGGLIEVPTALVAGEAIFGVSYNLQGPGGTFEVWAGTEPLPGATLLLPGAFLADDQVELGPGVLVESGAMIKGPTIIEAGAQVRQGAYIRGQVWAGAGSVLGHATEAKSSLLLPGAKAGHFAYLGDSVLGREVNLGAGTKLANLKFSGSPISLRVGSTVIALNRRKMGAILGDLCQTGCNAVTNPGTILGPGSWVAANQAVPAGYYPPRSRLGLA
ncbi:MAG: hypothetical protein LBR11_10875 [Deltaproteobacteria bacterium]|jgi:acetyltransferase-like isoleucine patch superfamily enzyme|nr:hypothetical protein [Deltaproteobacteria bacterium]